VIGINGRVPEGPVCFPMEQSHVLIPPRYTNQPLR
jgi:hypothetical protein